MTSCTFDPTPLKGLPIRQFRCFHCGCLVAPGLEHGACEDGCPMQDDDDRAVWAEAYALLERKDGT